MGRNTSRQVSGLRNAMESLLGEGEREGCRYVVSEEEMSK